MEEKTTTCAHIYSAMACVMEEMSAVTKDQRNDFHKFQYRGIDDVMNAFHPILAKNKIVVKQEILNERYEERETNGKDTLIHIHRTIRYTLVSCVDGSEFYTDIAGEAMDKADKTSNKVMASAYKYALLQTFCIPTEDEKDPDAQSSPPSTKKQPSKCICKQCGETVKAVKRGDELTPPEKVIAGTNGLCVTCFKAQKKVSA